MNRQPFYHRAVILFTATQDISSDPRVAALIDEALSQIADVVASSVVLDEIDAEPGDPADLV